DAADSEWVLSCGDESITFVSFESGFDSNKSFQPGPPRQRNFVATLGVLNIAKTGLNHLELTPRKLLGQGFSVKRITLTPYR
ncbi:hypothetical protein QEH59_06915, partial [Coraliomargarita sp. SDUM461004]